MTTRPKTAKKRSASAGAKTAEPRAIYVTDQDMDRLTELIERYDGVAATPGLEALDEELARAEVVPAKKIPADVVTMNSRVRFVDDETGESREVSLVYPNQADATAGRVSILAPVGSALLGLTAGQSIAWPLPSGKVRHLRVVEVLYQPEAAGDWDL